MNSENPKMARCGYRRNMVLAMVTKPIDLRCLIVIDRRGSASCVPVSSSTRRSMPSTRFSAAWACPCMNSHLGLSGTLRRTSKITTPSTTPKPKHTRHPTPTGRSLVAGTVSSAPKAAPAQYVPLIAMSIRPGT